MKPRLSLGRVFFGAIILSAISQIFFFHRELSQGEKRSVRFTLQAVGNVLDRAHRLNDDLTLQEAIRGLGEGSGALFAAVVDPQERIIAHSQTAWLGRSFRETPSNHYEFWRHRLVDSGGSWGELRLAISPRCRSTSMQYHSLFVLVQALLLACMGWHLFRSHQKRLTEIGTELQSARFDYLSLSQEQKLNLAAQQVSDLASRRRIQYVLEQVPRPLLLLDATQRCVGANSAFCRGAGLTAGDVKSGRSWQEVPAVAACGSALQQSVEHPFQKIEATYQAQTLVFTTGEFGTEVLLR